MFIFLELFNSNLDQKYLFQGKKFKFEKDVIERYFINDYPFKASGKGFIFGLHLKMTPGVWNDYENNDNSCDDDDNSDGEGDSDDYDDGEDDS